MVVKEFKHLITSNTNQIKELLLNYKHYQEKLEGERGVPMDVDQFKVIMAGRGNRQTGGIIVQGKDWEMRFAPNWEPEKVAKKIVGKILSSYVRRTKRDF